MKAIPKQRLPLRLLRGPLCGLLLFAAMSLLLAYLTGEGSIPMDATGPLLYAVLAFSALAAGAVCGGNGKRGLLTGAILAFLCIMTKAVLHSEEIFRVSTLIDLLCILPCAWIGSCIFHKKRRVNTKRNHRIQLRNYK